MGDKSSHPPVDASEVVVAFEFPEESNLQGKKKRERIRQQRRRKIPLKGLECRKSNNT